MRQFIAIVLSLFVGAANAQSIPFPGPGATSAYQGPGDIVSGALIWGSCARVYNASLASTSTSLCDLVDTTTGATAVCTLRGSGNGFVDLTNAYCTGSLTPAAACAAASGGACRVSKVYDQIGGTSGWVNATNSQRPVLTFSALNSLPGLTGTAAANTSLTTSATFTQAQPITLATVCVRTANFTTIQAAMGASGGLNALFGFSSAADTARLTSDGASVATKGSITDSSFHAMQGVLNGASSVIAIDGSETTGNAATSGWSANTSRIMRFAGGNSLDGSCMEFGMWPSGFSAGNRTSMNSNMHGSSGYNF